MEFANSGLNDMQDVLAVIILLSMQFTGMVSSTIMCLTVVKHLTKAPKPERNLSHQFSNWKPKSNANLKKKGIKVSFLKKSTELGRIKTRAYVLLK